MELVFKELDLRARFTDASVGTAEIGRFRKMIQSKVEDGLSFGVLGVYVYATGY